MTIENITYWHTGKTTSKNISNHEISQLLKDNKDTFNTTLFDMLFNNKNSERSSGINSSWTDPFPLGYDMQALNNEIANAKKMGFEKVLAERLKAPLPFLNQSDSDYSNNKYTNPLDKMTDLTIQLQIARAKQVIRQQHSHSFFSFDEFIGMLSSNSTVR